MHDDSDDLGKAFGVSRADVLRLAPDAEVTGDSPAGGKTIDTTARALTRDDPPMGHGDNVPPVRRLACASCGTSFTVHEGERALARKQRLRAGLPAEDADAHKAFVESAAEIRKARPW